MNWINQNRKLLEDSFVAGLLTSAYTMMAMACFVLATGFKPPEKQYIYTILLVFGILGGLYHFFRKHNKKMQKFETKQYAFTIIGCYVKNIANTEYDIFICRTTENKMVVFYYCLGKEVEDTFEIELQQGKRVKITSLKNYSTNKTVENLYFDDDFVEMCFETIEGDFDIFENLEELTQKLDNSQKKK